MACLTKSSQLSISTITDFITEVVNFYFYRNCADEKISAHIASIGESPAPKTLTSSKNLRLRQHPRPMAQV